MEIYDVGKHCHLQGCNLLDFLPYTCHYCSHTFCHDHWKHIDHNCTEVEKFNKVVPSCPLCNQPIPVKAGEDPNVQVDAHISMDCPKPPKSATKAAYTNTCSVQGCKKKEIIPFKCNACSQNFCIKHRHERDHQCPNERSPSPLPVRQGPVAKAVTAAQRRFAASKNQQQNKEQCLIS